MRCLSHNLTGRAGQAAEPFLSQNTHQGDGSRIASEPAPLSARGSQIPRLPATI
jgi:hypothetical protein